MCILKGLKITKSINIYSYILAFNYLLIFYVIISFLFTGTENKDFLNDSEHPFLLVSESEYDELKSRSIHSPWSEMKQGAIAYVGDQNNSYFNHLTSEPRNRALKMSNIMSKAALAFILDETNRTYYTKVILENLKYWDHLHADRHYYSNQWEYQVPAGEALYNSILALDIIRNKLTKEELHELHEKIETAVEFIYTGWDSWGLNKFAVRGLWAMYQGDNSHVSLEEYMERLYSFITEDGVFTPGTGYTYRISGTVHRDQKTSFMDILDRHGLYDIYGDTRLKRVYEWIYGYSFSPTGRYFTFGDSRPRLFDNSGLAAYRAEKFSKKAGAYAARSIKNSIPPPRLLHYVLMAESLPEPKKPTSRIFFDGGAWFMEKDVDEESLGGALWNATILGDYHQHKEVNAIHLSAYGEDIIRNVGYNGWGNGAHGFSWEYVNRTAVSGNTVMIDETNHQKRTGGGIIEGFTSNLFDYASGYSNKALPNGIHIRNFIFLHPEDDIPGYFLLSDEVVAQNSSSTVNLALHPNSNEYTIISDGMEYQWKIGPNYTDNAVYVNIFLGTKPENVDMRDGVLLAGHSTESGHLVGKYLYADYLTDENGKSNIISAIFPSKSAESTAEISRISDDEFSGIIVGHSEHGTVDYIIETDNSLSRNNYGKLHFKGATLFYRDKTNDKGVYFLRDGSYFNDGQIGFSSDQPISIHLRNLKGRVISNGTNVTFRGRDVKNVMINNSQAEILGSDNNSIKVYIPKGRHEIEFILK